MAAEDRIGAAYHEAGHAIVLWVFGLQVDSVAVASQAMMLQATLR